MKIQPILKIDLHSGEISACAVPPEWFESYLGGASLAARLLYDKLVPNLDALSPPAPLLFLNGPLSGTAGPAVGRFVVCGRSPATGLWGESNCGGFWGPELRMAGYDGLWVEGRAEKPVYVCIQDEKVEIRPAEHLWGLDTYTTQAKVLKEIQPVKARVACIGPGGEAMIPFASILVDHGRVAGRTGMGAIMGSKNLKAIAVAGTKKIPLIDPQRYLPLRSDANRQLRADSMTQVLRELGTSSGAEYFDYLQEMPKRYFQHGAYHEEIRISGASLKETILVGVSACHACVIACGRVVRLEDGEKRKGPEYETLVGFGPNLMLNDPVVATRLGELCDRYGLDTISLSNTIGLAFHLYEMGKISSADTGGLELAWGDTAAVETLIHQTVKRQNLGMHIAKGSRELGRRFGAEEEAVQVNGLEAAYHDPRGASGMALVYATSPRGACHNQSDYFFVDLGQVETSLGMQLFDRHDGAVKAANVAIHQNWRTVFNAMVMCIFSNVAPEMAVNLINAACGFEWTIDDLLLVGERGFNLKRAINLRFGLTQKGDRLPKAFLQPFCDSLEGDASFALNFDAMLQAYYTARGWDRQSGYPKVETLQKLGLDFLLPDLYPEAKG